MRLRTQNQALSWFGSRRAVRTAEGYCSVLLLHKNHQVFGAMKERRSTAHHVCCLIKVDVRPWRLKRLCTLFLFFLTSNCGKTRAESCFRTAPEQWWLNLARGLRCLVKPGKACTWGWGQEVTVYGSWGVWTGQANWWDHLESYLCKNLRTWGRVVNLLLVMEIMSRGWHLAMEPYLKRWERAELWMVWQ